jgi:Cu-Zn family superoxide dismutase
MKRVLSILSIVGMMTGVVLVSLAGSTAKGKGEAMAVLESKSGSTVTGTATFKQKGDGVEATIDIKGAKPGQHGLHLHETGDCSAPDAKSAGAHFNPDSKAHGAPDADPHHAGDLGNITIGSDGKGKLKITIKGLTVDPGPHSVVGRAVVFHADPDDLKSQPAGNAGARFACGVIKAQ